jgi:hypothetical protein
VREARHNPPGDQSNEHDHPRNAETDAVIDAPAPERFAMEYDITGDEHAEPTEYSKIAPVLSGDDLAHRNGCKRYEKCDVYNGSNRSAQYRGGRNRHAAGQPQRHETGQWVTIDG